MPPTFFQEVKNLKNKNDIRVHELVFLPPNFGGWVTIPPLQKFIDAPYKFERRIAECPFPTILFIDENKEGIAVIPPLGREEEYPPVFYWKTRTSNKVYKVILPKGFLPRNLRYYTNTSSTVEYFSSFKDLESKIIMYLAGIVEFI